MDHSTSSSDGTAESVPGSGDESRASADGGTAAPADESTVAKEWAIFVGALFATAGSGIAVFFELVDAVDTEVSNTTGNLLPWGLGSAATIAIVIATFAGVFFAWRFASQETATKTAFGSMLAGTFGLVVLRVGIAGILSDNSLAGVGLIINALIAGLVAGAVGAVGVRIVQELAPGEIARGATSRTSLGHTSD